MKLKTKFQDEDFKLGEVTNVDIATMPDGRIKAQALAKAGGFHTFFYDDLETFGDDWEDYEEPKECYYIDCDGEIYEPVRLNDSDLDKMTSIGNYFETKEEAEKAVEKLKTLKRLKNNNLRFSRGCITFVNTDEVFTTVDVRVKVDTYSGVDKDLDLLFGDEE